MKPDNIISRIVRPSILIWLTVFFTVLAVTDGNFFDFTVRDVYVTTLETILVAAYGGYFLGKSYEHATRINKEGSWLPKTDREEYDVY